MFLHRRIPETPLLSFKLYKFSTNLHKVCKKWRNKITETKAVLNAVKAMAAKTNDSVFTAVIFLLVFAFHCQNKCLECFYAVNSIDDIKHKQAFLNSLPKPLGNEIGARFSVQMTVAMKKIQSSTSCCTKQIQYSNILALS